jgi:site-specific recombinase XerD
MKLALAIQEYVEHKRSLGMLFKSSTVRLKAFLKQLGDVELESITPEQVTVYLNGTPGPVTSFWFAKHTALNGFFQYGINCCYLERSPLPSVLPQPLAKFLPYIYSVADMRRLLEAADSRHRFVWLLEPHTVRCLLLLLYGTGVRIGEATRLTISDVDFHNRTLMVRGTKFFKTRMVPFGSDLARVLGDYYASQWADKSPKPDSRFLCTRTGNSITIQTAELVFYRLRAEAGISRSDGARYQPRLHDFRHTFAVTRLVTWYREGKNVQRLLPHLSTYMGHVRIADTARYLTLTKELLQGASRCFELYAMPEVSHD